MSLLLLFGGGSAGSTPGDSPSLDCIVDVCFVEATAEIEAQNGIFAMLPGVEATAEIQGYSILDVMAEIAPIVAKASLRSTSVLDCVAELPLAQATMLASLVPFVSVSCELPPAQAWVTIGLSGSTLGVLAELPCVLALASLSPTVEFSFPDEADAVLKYSANMRLL